MSVRQHVRKNVLSNSSSDPMHSLTEGCHKKHSGLQVVNWLRSPTLVQAKLGSNSHSTQQEIENQEFRQNKFEATKLEIQAKYGTLTPENTERLGVLQAKMNGLFQTRLKQASCYGHNIANISVSLPNTPSQQAVQTKLAIASPSDKFETEADRIATQVMKMSEPAPPVQQQSLTEKEESVQTRPIAISEINTASLQRKCLKCSEQEQAQRSGNGKTEAGNDIESRLNSSKGGGSPLSNEMRTFVEPRFGYDFSKVRVHTDSQAVQMNRELGAQAFTHGSDIYYGGRKFSGNNDLTAHELTHIVQQTGRVQTKLPFNQLTVQRQCSACEKEEEKIQRSPDPSTISKPIVQGFWSDEEEETKSEGNSDSGGVLDWLRDKLSDTSFTGGGGESGGGGATGSWDDEPPDIELPDVEPPTIGLPNVLRIPKVYIDPNNYPESAQHAQEAINAGRPTKVTIDRLGANKRRKNSVNLYKKKHDCDGKNKGKPPCAKSGQDYDEYPQAVFEENGGSAHVKPIAGSDNRGSGASIGNQCRPYNNGDKVKIVVGSEP